MGLDWERKDFEYLYAQKRLIGFKVSLFCYDIIPVKLPQACVNDVAAVFALYFTNVAWCADQILCISQSSLHDLTQLLEELGAPQRPMQVVHLGCDIRSVSGIVSPQIHALCEKPFLLFVSTIERRKNHETLYRAYIELINQGNTNLPQLVFVGKIGWGIADLLKDLKLDPRIQPYILILNHVTDAELSHLYENSLCTLYPSLYEGWGLPIAESLAHGKFCLVSNNSSLPEVGGDYVEYLDAWDVPGWSKRIYWYWKNPSALREKERFILANYRVQSWEDSSKSIVNSAVFLASH
jgi:glycosyltransferase involved in cell wall biosynthesis